MNRPHRFECTSSCRSLQHGSQVTAAIIRGTEAQAIAYMRNVCQKCHMITDASGKTALHTAASCGKRKVVRWLLAKGVPLNQRDWESGYTPLHRALFYGRVDIAVALIQAGANIGALDHDALTPLDHINFDRPPVVSFTFSLPKHVYVWGSNDNYNLGQTSQRAREIPEWLDFLHREGQVIADVVLNKYHTLFLATSGRVYACGLGHGGRLGINVSAPVITPCQIKTLMQNNVVKVAAGPDHSLFLTDTGQVWSCGANSYHQLGIIPPPESVYAPKLLSWHKNHKEEAIVGIGAAKYHSVIWTSRVLYTFGLNAGQIGHFKNDNETTITNPRSVTSIVLREEGTLACVGVSDGATVVSTSFGDIYVLHQYMTRKVASKMVGVVKIACIGGHLDSRVGADGLKDQGGASLKIAVLVGGGVGHLYLWTEDTAHLSRCLFSINRKISLVDFCLNVSSLAIVTDDGEAFSAIALPPRKRKATDKVLGKPWKSSQNFNEFVDRGSCVMLRLTRIAALHRTIAVMCDPKGRNFAALQNEPNSFLLDLPQVSKSTMNENLSGLLQTTDEMDTIHDVVIKCGTRRFPAHSYILAHHSSYFKEQLIKEEGMSEENSADVQRVCGSPQDSDVKSIPVPDIKPEIMQEILTYVYSGSCQLTTLGRCDFKMFSSEEDVLNGNSFQANKWVLGVNAFDPKQSAYSVYKDEKVQGKTSSKKKKKGQKNVETKMHNTLSSSNRPLEFSSQERNKKPLQLLQSAARYLGITSLVKEIEKLEMVNGFIQLKYGYSERDLKANQNHHYSREDYQDLWDVMIESKSGDVLGAHKCMLAARLEYFNCMFSASWKEALSSRSLSMPLPTSILALLLDYLCEDDSSKLHYCKDVEFLCNVLTVADQFLVSRLREICEVAISRLLTLKNAGEILEFATNYNADQLKVTTMQFISLNLAAMLENGSLLSVSSDVLADLSEYYRQFIPRMSCRLLTPFDQPPYAEELEHLLVENPLTLPESEGEWDEDVCLSKGEKHQTSVRKKKRSRCNSQGDPRSRKTSTSSVLSFSSSDGDMMKSLEDDFETLDFDDLEERIPPESPVKNTIERKSSDLEYMLPLKEDTEITSHNHQMLDLGSWQKVGKKKHASGQSSINSPTETPRESPVRENGVMQDIIISKQTVKTTRVPISAMALPSKASDVPFESPESKFPSLAESFIKTPKSSNPTKTNKINKLSQKQRKKQAAEAAAATAAAEAGVAATASDSSKVSNSSKSASPWGKSTLSWGSDVNGSNSTEPIKSHTLADIIKAEEASFKAKQVSAPINIQRARKTSETIGSFTPTRKGWGTGETPPAIPSSRDSEGGAWASLATSPSANSVHKSIVSPGSPYSPQQESDTPCFSKILLEEEKFMGNLLRERCKPLSLIQLEDRAIEELLAFYGANECFDERISVTRVKLAMANPQWKKS